MAAAEAEEAGRHLMLLGDINLAMTSTFDTDEAVDRFAHLVVPLLADWCLVSVVDPDGTRRDVGRAHRDPALVEAMHRYADLRVATNRPTAPVPRCCRDPGRSSFPHFTAEHIDAMVASPEARAALEPLQPSAVAAFPLIARGEVFGALTLVNGPSGARTRTPSCGRRRSPPAGPRSPWTTPGWPRANQQVAERLQLSLLSPPVQPDHLELAVRYRPATQGVSIGGDWYDAFLQPDGDTVLVIGDVMGHDIEAAAAMGQVKTLVRGIAYDRVEEPAEVLRRVDHALVGLAVPAMATALVCRVEQDDADRAAGLRRLRWSSAGHPDPMLLLADGTVIDLAAPVGPPLGIGWLGRRVDGLATLPQGSTLLLFTDGLFERRGVPLDDGRDQVREILRRSADLPLEELCDRLLAEMLGEGVEDDVAVLAVRAHPVHVARPLEAGPELLPPALPRCADRLAQARLIANAVRKPTVVISAGPGVGVLERLRDHRVRDHGEDGAGGDRGDHRLHLGRRAAEQHVAEQRGQPAGHGDPAPDAEDVAGGAAVALHAGGAGQALGHVGDEHGRQHRQAHRCRRPAARAPGRRTRGRRRAAPRSRWRHRCPTAPTPRAAGPPTVCGAGRPGGRGRGSRRGTRRRRRGSRSPWREQAAGVGRLLHEVEGDGGDEHAGAEGHHRRDDLGGTG